MNIRTFYAFLVFFLLISGCSQAKNEEVDPFFEDTCHYEDGTRDYVSKNIEECKFVRFGCNETSYKFVNGCGCGCQKLE